MTKKSRDQVGTGIGHRLRLLREALGWTQAQLSQYSNLRRTEISTIEQGRNRGSSWRVRTFLANALGLARERLDWYWRGELSLEDVLGEMRPVGPTPRLSGLKARLAPSEPGPLDYRRAAELAGRNLNLYVAGRLVSTELGVDESAAAQAVQRLATRFTGPADLPILRWVQMLEVELGERRAVARRGIRWYPALSTAIQLVIDDSGAPREAVQTAAAELLEQGWGGRNTSVVKWIHGLEAALQPTLPHGSLSEPDESLAARGSGGTGRAAAPDMAAQPEPRPERSDSSAPESASPAESTPSPPTGSSARIVQLRREAHHSSRDADEIASSDPSPTAAAIPREESE